MRGSCYQQGDAATRGHEGSAAARRQSRANVREEEGYRDARAAVNVDEKDAAEGARDGFETGTEHAKAEEMPHTSAEDTPSEPSQELQVVGEATDDAPLAVGLFDFVFVSHAPGAVHTHQGEWRR